MCSIYRVSIHEYYDTVLISRMYNGMNILYTCTHIVTHTHTHTRTHTHIYILHVCTESSKIYTDIGCFVFPVIYVCVCVVCVCVYRGATE